MFSSKTRSFFSMNWKGAHGGLHHFIIIAAVYLLVRLDTVPAAWVASPSENLAVCTAVNEQHFPVLTSDGEAGAIVVWSDARAGNRDIFAQRVSGTGQMLWYADGIPVCDTPASQSWPLIVGAPKGGAIIVWGDTRAGNQDIYAQRIDADGVKQWAPDGISVCTEPALQDGIKAVADGAGGVIVTWEDWRNGNQDIYAQRIDATGATVWETNGVPVYKGPGDQYDPVLIADGSGAAIFAWWDISTSDWNIFAQRLSPAGEPMWGHTADGHSAQTPVCTANGNQGGPAVVSDENGGAFFVWSDYRNEPNFYTSAQLYAQRIDSDGKPQWQKDGIPMSNLHYNQQQPACIADGAGGFIVVWWDEREVFADIYAQRTGPDGTILWAIEGVAVCTGAGVQRAPQLVPDGDGGAIVYWLDYREDFGDKTEDAIYAQRLHSTGEALWQKDGMPVCTANNQQITPQAITATNGSAIIVWSDARGQDYDVYIHRVPK